MRKTWSLLAFVILVGCASPVDWLQKPSSALTALSNAFKSYEDFKDTIRSNAKYSQITYRNSTKSGYAKQISRQQILADVCLRYDLAEDVKYTDIKRRLDALTNVLKQVKTTLCAAPGNGGLAKADADACQKEDQKSLLQAALDLSGALNAAASLTPLSGYTQLANTVLQAFKAGSDAIAQQRAYVAVIDYLSDPATQTQIKYAIERLESDIQSIDQDLEDNMRIWTTCETARLNLAANTLAWDNGANQIVFSTNATDFMKSVDLVQKTYLDYKTSFVPNTTKSLAQLQVAFATLPTLKADPSALQTVITAFDGVYTNLQKLQPAGSAGTATASNGGTKSTKKTASLWPQQPTMDNMFMARLSLPQSSTRRDPDSNTAHAPPAAPETKGQRTPN